MDHRPELVESVGLYATPHPGEGLARDREQDRLQKIQKFSGQHQSKHETYMNLLR
jgi:hypothetical protein